MVNIFLASNEQNKTILLIGHLLESFYGNA
jgi:hypothetical protein